MENKLKGVIEERSKLADAVANLEEAEVNRILHERVRAGEVSLVCIEELREGIAIVGERYNRGEYFLAEMIYSAEIFKNAMNIIEPLIEKTEQRQMLGKMVIGTVRGDIHDLGKNIAVMLLRIVGFEVFDLGVDVAPRVFVQKVNDSGASILGLSGLLTVAFESMKETVDAIVEAGLRSKVKIIIGGGTATELLRQYVGADAYTNQAVGGVEICRHFVQKVSAN